MNIDLDTIIVRHERQTFRRLILSNAVVFTVHTSIRGLVDIPVHERANLVAEIKAWPKQIATYKGRDLWERAVVGWCEGRNLIVADDRSFFSDDQSSTAEEVEWKE